MLHAPAKHELLTVTPPDDGVCAKEKSRGSRHKAGMTRSGRAFSLVELSIVLVILGLLVGGVLSGQALIRAAELRSIPNEAFKHQAAVLTFRDKYFALPGDMTNATQFWGIAGGTTGNDTTCKNTGSTTGRTCNGNGNGLIDESNGAYEEMRFWQHLASAGLIEGSYNGIGSGGGTSYVGTAPSSKANRNAYWVPYGYGFSPATTDSFGGDWGNAMELYEQASAWLSLKPEDAWNVDQKLDDGIPYTGKIWSHKGDTTYPCTTRANQLTDTGAAYNLAYSGKACYFVFAKAF